MTDEHIIQHLRRSRPGQMLRDEDLAKLSQIAELEHRSAGARIFDEGSVSDAIWIVCEGTVAIEMHVSGRGRVRILTLGPGDLLGWSGFIGDGVMTASATVIEDAQLLKFPTAQLKELCETDHTLGYAVAKNVAIALSQRLTAARLQALDLYGDGTTRSGT